MYEVVATFPAGEKITFYEPRYGEGSELKKNALLAHPERVKPKEITVSPFALDASWNFYSVEFTYSVPDSARPKGISGPGYHISFGYDEEEGSRRLTKAINTLDVAILRLGFRATSQYVWPDGSLYYWFVSRATLEEFRSKEIPALEREMEAISMRPFSIREYYRDGKKKRSYLREFGESRVRVLNVRKVEAPLRDCHKPGILNLVDLFNRTWYANVLGFARVGEMVVEEKLGSAFEEGFTVAYGHQNLFTSYLERYTPEESKIFTIAHSLAEFLQLLTE